MASEQKQMKTLSVVIPCYNEEKTLEKCVERVLQIADESLALEIVIVDDCSSDHSAAVAKRLEERHGEIKLLRHEKNQGKGAALKTGFRNATGDYVAVQDADLEYHPNDLKRLIVPLTEEHADVVFGSRFLTAGAHRVLYFWHYMGNRFLTILSNMFTDLNLTDMETCYKVFRRELIQQVDIEENRFGIEPEITAKIAQMRPRIYEMGISYYGRTYEEGKKIGVKDGFRALYCIFRYNAHNAPLPAQFLMYSIIGGISAVVNLLLFLPLYYAGMRLGFSAPIAFFAAAALNYQLCTILLFRQHVKWKSSSEILVYCAFVAIMSIFDLIFTSLFLGWNFSPIMAKIMASIVGFLFNFSGRRFIVFPEKATRPWGKS